MISINNISEQLSRYLIVYCDSEEETKVIGETSSCEKLEYEETKKYLEHLDNMIQNLFKGNIKESKKQGIVLGFISLSEMFDVRLEKLFIQELACPDEVDLIKYQYM